MKHDTYYVYDQYGNLTFVIPPLVNATTTISNIILNDLCYQYKYDYRNRLVEKKLPGKQWEFIVYDKLDRVVATGPAFSPFSNSAAGVIGWLITKYDSFNRIIITGWLPTTTVTSADRNTLQMARNNETTNISESRTATNPDVTINEITFRYTNNAFPTTGYHVLTINYYDDYNYPNPPNIPALIKGQAVFYNNTVKPIGLQTGSWIRACKTSNSHDKEIHYTLYDYKARPIRTFFKNDIFSTGGYTQVDTKYDFTKVLYTITYHKRTTNIIEELIVKEEFTYTPQDRLLTHTHQVNALPVQLLASNTYDELGQLISKNVGNTVSTPDGADINKFSVY